MSKRIRELIDKIQKNEDIHNEFFDDDLIIEIINLEDITTFHLVLNYIEKINTNYSSYIMEQKKKKYDLLIKSFDPDSNLFDRDKNLIIEIKSYIEKVKLNRSVLNSKYNEIETTFKANLTNYNKIESVIVSSLDGGKTFEFVVNKLKGENLLSNNDFKTIENFYNKYKEYYELDNKMYSEEQNFASKLLSIMNENYLEETCKIIRKSINVDNMDLIEKTINDYNKELIKKMIISNFFEDVPENFLKNLNNIITFQSEIDRSFIKTEILKIYQSIITTFQDGDINQLISLFNYLKESKIDYKSEFYDDFTNARKTNAELIMNSVYRVDKNNEEYGVLNGVKCYSLTGQPFYMMIHGSPEQITDFQNGPHDATSMSLISGKRLNVFNDGVIYGFDELNPEQFIELYTKDTSTEFDIGIETKSLLEAIPRYYTPQEFIEKTPDNQYNEIIYLSGNNNTPEIDPPKPSYIVCIDQINQDSIEIAKKLGIPIVIIETKYYPEIKKNNMGHFAFLDEQEVYKTL